MEGIHPRSTVGALKAIDPGAAVKVDEKKLESPYSSLVNASVDRCGGWRKDQNLIKWLESL
jgi:hypothetical protein